MDSTDDLSVLESYVDGDETPIEAESDDATTYLLTDRRLLSCHRSRPDGDVTTVTSLLHDAVGYVSVRHEDGRDFDEEKLKFGVLSGVLAVICIALISQVEGSMVEVLGITSLVLGLLALILLLQAFDTKTGMVTISLESPEGDRTITITLETELLGFAQDIARTASAAHATVDSTTRRVG